MDKRKFTTAESPKTLKSCFVNVIVFFYQTDGNAKHSNTKKYPKKLLTPIGTLCHEELVNNNRGFHTT